jgi:hypothetical protein
VKLSLRLALAASIAVAAAAPFTATAHAWSCQDEVGQAACLVVATVCRPLERNPKLGIECTVE